MSATLNRCPACGEENPERFRFCGVCGANLVTPPTQPRESRKTVTILFADVSGSTALGNRLDPESMRRLLSRHFSEMRAILQQHGGTVEKFIGDAVMAVFGVPTIHEDDALRAVRAASDIRAAVARLKAEDAGDAPIVLRTGINTGEVVTGDPSTGETLVTGDAVNMAARLEQSAAPGEILLGALTWQLVRDAVDATAVGPIAVKGKDAPISAYRLDAVKDAWTGQARRLDSALVNRERELRTLRRVFEDVEADRRCHLLTLLAPAGMGKTRLLAEVLRTTAVGARVIRGQCLPYGQGIGLWPLREMLQELQRKGGLSEPSPMRQLAALTAAEAPTPGEGARMADAIGGSLGLEDRAVDREELFWAVRRLFEGLAATSPLVVIFDDLHWAEPILHDLIDSLADLSREAPILLVCAARPELLELRPTWGGGKLNATTMLLEPLSAASMDQLLTNLAAPHAVPASLRARVIEASDGLPLYVEELVAMLSEQGWFGDDAEARPSAALADLADLPAPPTVQAIVAARLERLRPAERVVVERASVIGRGFDRAALAELLPEDARAGMDAALADLVRKEVIRPDGGAGRASYRFRHQLVRDTAYASLPKETRAALHRRFAERLADVDPGGADEFVEIRGHHLAEAHGYLRQLGASPVDLEPLAMDAASALFLGGRRAFARHDSSGTEALLTRAAALLPDDVPERIEMELVLAEAQRQRGDLRAAAERLESVRLRANAAGLTTLAARAEIFGTWLEGSLQPRDWAAAVAGVTARWEPALEASRDHEGLSLLWGLRLDAAMAAARVDSAEAAAHETLTHAQLAPGPWQLGRRARSVLGELTVLSDMSVEEAIDRCEALLADGREDRRLVSSLLTSIARLRAMQGQPAAAAVAIEEALVMAGELNLLYGRAFGAQAAAFVARLAGDGDMARDQAGAALRLLMDRGDRRAAAGVQLDLAEMHVEANEDDDARALLAEASADGGVAEGSSAAMAAGLEAVLAARSGRAEAARLHAERAVAIASATQSPIWLSRALMAQAMALAATGDSVGSAASADLALDLLRAKGAVGLAAHVAKLLAGRPSPATPG